MKAVRNCSISCCYDYDEYPTWVHQVSRGQVLNITGTFEKWGDCWYETLEKIDGTERGVKIRDIDDNFEGLLHEERKKEKEMNGGQKNFDAFLSHDWANGNHAIVEQIKRSLQEEGLRVWLDSEQLHGRVMEGMADGILSSKVFVAFLTPNYVQKVEGRNKSDNCKREFDFASLHSADLEGFLAVPMDKTLQDPKKWGKVVGMQCGADLFEVKFTNGFDKSEAKKLASCIRKLIQ